MQVGKNSYQFKLVKKLDGDKPPKLTLEKLAQMMQNGFDKINQRIDKIDQRIDKIDNRLTQIVKANNLIDPTSQK